jgi:hypothetical protein
VAIRYSSPEPYTVQFSNKCWLQILIFVGRLGSWLSSHFSPLTNSSPNLKFNLICLDMLPEIFTIPLSPFSTASLPYISIRSHGFLRARNTCRLAWQRYFPTVQGFKIFMPPSFVISARVACECESDKRIKCRISIVQSLRFTAAW